MQQVNLSWPIKFIQNGFKIAKTPNKTKDIQSRDFERNSRLIETIDDAGTGQREHRLHCTREQNQENWGEYTFLKVKSQNVLFEFSTNYLHFVLKKAA